MGSGYASAHTSLARSNSSSHTMFNISGKNVFIKGQYFVFTNSGVSVLKNEHYSNQNRKWFDVSGAGKLTGEKPKIIIFIKKNDIYINGMPMGNNINAVVDEHRTVFMGSFVRSFDYR